MILLSKFSQDKHNLNSSQFERPLRKIIFRGTQLTLLIFGIYKLYKESLLSFAL